MKSANRFVFPFLLFLIAAAICLSNFKKGTFLVGWDNLQADLDLSINLERSLNVAWQEYQGLGLLGGMGHGADLFRQLAMIPFSLVINQNLLRYFGSFLSLLTGVLGSYFLFLYFTKNRLISFLGATFYLLNIGTVQNFYATFEPFSAFFAFLPWLLWLLFRYLEKANSKNLLLFSLLSLFGTTFAYVQTIFLVYLLLLLIILGFFILWNNFLTKRERVWNSFKILLIVFVTNAFWLLPTSFFTLTSSEVTSSAKGNSMTTEQVFLRNNKFGNFYDLAQLKGYWFDFSDFDQSGNMVFLLNDWKVHFQNPLVTFTSFGYFILLLLGAIYLLFSRKTSNRLKRYHWLFLILFLFCCFILLGSNPPLGFAYDFLRDNVPLFGQIFRSSFTKWVVPFSLFYSLLLTFGLAFIFSLLKKKWLQWLFSVVFFVSLIFYSWPSFQGHFFYERLRVQIPDAYFKLFAYFKDEAPASSRIANLPQHSFYGWQWNDWGYRGSGFLWYGIKQPILDRAFDVWSSSLEGYYWELQAALDYKDVARLENVWRKYDVNYVLLDASVVNRNTAKPFNYAAMRDLLESSKQLELVREWGFLRLYRFVDEMAPAADFVSLYTQAPLANNSYRHSWQDEAFADWGDYFSLPTDDFEASNNQAQNAVIIYPFSSQFTNHAKQDLPFKIEEDANFFYLTSIKDVSKSGFAVMLPDFDLEPELPFDLSWRMEKNKLHLTFELLSPAVYFKDHKYDYKLQREIVLDAAICKQSIDCKLNINGELTDLAGLVPQRVLLSSKLPNVIGLSRSEADYFDYELFDLQAVDAPVRKLSNQSVGENELTVQIPKIMVQSNLLETDLNQSLAKNCRGLDQGSVVKEIREDGNYYLALGASVCDYFYLANLSHRSSYLWRLEADALRSLPFVFAIQSQSLGRSTLETYLNDGVNYQILPPTEAFHQGYTMYLSTDSYGHEANDNLLGSATVFAWPYRFLEGLYLGSAAAKPAVSSDCNFVVDKKALWLYQVSLDDNCQARYLKLSQAFDQGWLALANGRLLPHYKWNNWANAWELPIDLQSKHKTYIFFWPQLLQYLGFGLLFGLLWKLSAAFLKHPRL